MSLRASVYDPWTVPESTRPCYGNYYQHPISQADLNYAAATGVAVRQTYYDGSGYCVPPAAALPLVETSSSGFSIWTILIIGGVAYLVWHYRKSIFK